MAHRASCAIVASIVLMAYLAFPAHAAPRKLVVGYFAGWSESPQRRIADIRGDLLTHINYAFGKIEDGQLISDDASRAPAEQLRRLKEMYPHLRTLISVGGWGGSAPFSDIALTDESRTRFAKSCATYLQSCGFDGIDVDWEYPTGDAAGKGKGRPEDTRNLTLLLKSIRASLDEQGKSDGKKYLLTIAAPAGPQNIVKIELDKIHPFLDWINVMTYDYTGGWSPITSFNAPLAPASTDPRASLSVATTMQAYLSAGVPAEKLVMGVPFYGHAFGGVANVDNGLFQSHDKKRIEPPGGGGWTYRAISQNSIVKMQRFWHADAKVPWLFDVESGVMISYDDPESIRIKAEYARDHNFAGVMIWEITQDDDNSSLLKAVNAGLQSK